MVNNSPLKGVRTAAHWHALGSPFSAPLALAAAAQQCRQRFRRATRTKVVWRTASQHVSDLALTVPSRFLERATRGAASVAEAQISAFPKSDIRKPTDQEDELEIVNSLRQTPCQHPPFYSCRGGAAPRLAVGHIDICRIHGSQTRHKAVRTIRRPPYMSAKLMWLHSVRLVQPAHPINLAVGSPTPQSGVIFGARTLFLNNIQSRVPLLSPHHSHRKITAHWPLLTPLVHNFHNLRNLECFLVVFAIRYRQR